jgi:hypothetical protein
MVVQGVDIFGSLSRFSMDMFIKCPYCKNYGYFPGDKELPLTIIPDFKLRKAYNYIDYKLKCLWMQHRITEAEVMDKMSELMYEKKRAYRTYYIRTRDEAIRAYRFACQLYKEYKKC